MNFEVSQDCQEHRDFRYLVNAFERSHAFLFSGPVEDRHRAGRNGHRLPVAHGHAAARGSGRVCAEALCHLLRASGTMASKSVEAKRLEINSLPPGQVGSSPARSRHRPLLCAHLRKKGGLFLD